MINRLFVGGSLHGTRRFVDCDRMSFLGEDDDEPDEVYVTSKIMTVTDRFADDGKTVIKRTVLYFKVMTDPIWTKRLWDHDTRAQAEREIASMLCVDAYRADIFEGDSLKMLLADLRSDGKESSDDR